LGTHVHATDVVGFASLGLKLLTRGKSLRLGMLRCHGHFEVWRATDAQVRLGIPAHFRANPASAFRALLEVALGFTHGFLDRRIVRPASYRPLNLVR
jgi:hypothetical protein